MKKLEEHDVTRKSWFFLGLYCGIAPHFSDRRLWRCSSGGYFWLTEAGTQRGTRILLEELCRHKKKCIYIYVVVLTIIVLCSSFPSLEKIGKWFSWESTEVTIRHEPTISPTTAYQTPLAYGTVGYLLSVDSPGLKNLVSRAMMYTHLWSYTRLETKTVTTFFRQKYTKHFACTYYTYCTLMNNPPRLCTYFAF